MNAIAEIAGTSLDAQTFRANVVEACRPAVLRALCIEWPAYDAAREAPSRFADYLRQFDIGKMAEAFRGESAIAGQYHYGGNPDGFNFDRQSIGILDMVDKIAGMIGREDTPSLYMGSIPLDTHLPGFASDNPQKLLPDSIVPRIWMGSASRIACHFDTMDNLACVVAGARRFTLYPPEAIADLYVGPIDHTLAGQPVSLAAASLPGDPRFPRFEAIREQAIVVELAAGDALYLPKLWWHQVEATAPFNVLVNYWWDAFAAGRDTPHTAMLLSMITLAERPPHERSAWRAFFNHYVFRESGHPLAHLPREQHGILGPLRPHNYGRIRTLVMRLLRDA